MINVQHKVQGKKLLIEVDLSAPAGESDSGKSYMVAKTGGFIPTGHEDFQFSLNVIKPIPKSQRKTK